jgi:hypothetical protein
MHKEIPNKKSENTNRSSLKVRMGTDTFQLDPAVLRQRRSSRLVTITPVSGLDNNNVYGRSHSAISQRFRTVSSSDFIDLLHATKVPVDSEGTKTSLSKQPVGLRDDIRAYHIEVPHAFWCIRDKCIVFELFDCYHNGWRFVVFVLHYVVFDFEYPPPPI